MPWCTYHEVNRIHDFDTKYVYYYNPIKKQSIRSFVQSYSVYKKTIFKDLARKIIEVKVAENFFPWSHLLNYLIKIVFK